jgi:hypothetical protein
MTATLELLLIFGAVICGVLSAAYLYEISSSFTIILGGAIKWIAGGMMIIAAGVLIAAYISYAERLGATIYLYGMPLQAYFFILYIVGSICIAVGAKKFVTNPVRMFS